MAAVNKVKPQKKVRMTVSEFFALPTDEHCETELVYGKMVVRPKSKPSHNHLLHNLGEILRRWVSHEKLGRMFFDNDLILDAQKDLVYAPDLMFLANENASRCRDDPIFGPADLCVEILSPFKCSYRNLRSFTDYERYGIPWYWVIDIDAEQPTLCEYQLLNGIYVCRSEILGDQWFESGLFSGLVFRLPLLLEGDLKAAVKGKAKKLM